MNMPSRHLLPFSALALAGLLVSFSAWALTDHDREILTDFYLDSGGEQWLRKDGWLEPDSDPCDWHGIDCLYDITIERNVVQRLELPANNLTGTLDTRIFEVVHSALDLSDNRIGGFLDRLPASPGEVDLSNNRLSGNIPAEHSQRARQISGSRLPTGNWFLDLSGNDFEGEVPEEWSGTVWLSLANNRLEGLPLSLLSPDSFGFGGRFLDLSDNQFSGLITAADIDTERFTTQHLSRWGGGLNLCWNDFEIDDPQLRESIGIRHVGGLDFEACLGTQRLPPGPALSGSWYDPARSGEGISLHLLDNGRPLLYWFSFDEEGRQMWLFEVGQERERALDWRSTRQTRGRFGLGLDPEVETPAIETRGSFRLNQIGADLLQAERVYITDTSLVCVLPYPPPLSCFGASLSDRLDYRRLTTLAGTSCETQSWHQERSGAWFDPERNGEGLIIEVLPDHQVVVYWFTYQPDDSGQQAWMIGMGAMQTPIIGTPPPGTPIASVQIDPLYQPTGARYGEAFDPDDIELVEWGSMTIGFMRDGTGQVTFESQIPGFGEGQFTIQQLARPQLAQCSDDQ